MPEPRRNFVNRWVDFASKTTEAPDNFHRYMAYVGVSVALGKKAWMEWGTAKLFPNMYILFLAKSGSLKSHAADMMKDALSEVSEDLETPPDFTSASLDQIIYKRKAGLIAPDEFSIILRNEEGHFSTVKTILTSIFNCPKKYRLRYRIKDVENDKKTVEHPVFSFVTSTTPNTFVKDAKIEDMKSGFLSRFLIVPADNTRRCFNRPRSSDQEEYKNLLSSLATAYKSEFIDQNRPITLSEEADKIHDDWYRQIKGLIETDQNYSELSNAIIRINAYAFKFAMLESVISWSEREEHPVIHQDHMIKGITLANEAIGNLFKCTPMLESEDTRDRHLRNLSKAETYVSSNGSVTKAELYSHLKRVRKFEMDDVIKTLVDSGKVELDHGPNGKVILNWKAV